MAKPQKTKRRDPKSRSEVIGNWLADHMEESDKIKKKLKAIPIRDLDDVFRDSWNNHNDATYPKIKKLDQQTMEAIAQAPFIVVTNSRK